MKILLRTLITAILALIISHYLDGITLQGGLITSLILALVLSLLNAIIKPILVVLTLPVTIFSLGLFLLVINAAIVILSTKLVHGFHVDGFWTALKFSIILSLSQSIMFRLTSDKNE